MRTLILYITLVLMASCAPRQSCDAYDNYDQKQRELYGQGRQ